MCDVEKIDVFVVVTPRTSFNDVRCDGPCSLSELGAEAVALLCGKFLRRFIDLKYEAIGEAKDVQLALEP